MKLTVNIDNGFLTKEVEDFIGICEKCVNLYDAKNHDYGNSFDKGMEVMGLTYGLGRIYDKVNRLITLNKLNNIQETHVVNETIEDTAIDLACYAIMLTKYINNLNQKEIKQ